MELYYTFSDDITIHTGYCFAMHDPPVSTPKAKGETLGPFSTHINQLKTEFYRENQLKNL